MVHIQSLLRFRHLLRLKKKPILTLIELFSFLILMSLNLRLQSFVSVEGILKNEVIDMPFYLGYKSTIQNIYQYMTVLIIPWYMLGIYNNNIICCHAAISHWTHYQCSTWTKLNGTYTYVHVATHRMTADDVWLSPDNVNATWCSERSPWLDHNPLPLRLAHPVITRTHSPVYSI